MDEGYSQLGELLRYAREEKHITIEHASHDLHIRARYLQAMEAGQFSDLPGSAYAKGYLQSYASYLQLDRMEIQRRFEQVEGVLSRKAFFFPQVFSREKQAGNQAVYGGLAAALLIYLLWAWWLSPDRADVSLVDTPASTQEKSRISAVMMQDVSCFQPRDVLYPACYGATRQKQIWLPVSRPMETIMELAQTP